MAPGPARASAWLPMLDAAQAERALDAALMIAERVTDPERVRAAVELAGEQTRFPLSVHWEPESLAQGDAGQALLCAQLARCFPGDRWLAAGHAHLARAVAAVQRRGGGAPSVFSGLSGLAFTAMMLGGEREAYRRLRGVLGAEVAAGCLSQVAALHGRSGMPVSAFDLISGLAGVTAYLLATTDGEHPPPALPYALRALAELTMAQDPTAQDPLPAWHTPVHLLYDDNQARQYPFGNLNCGLAHGIPGPLAIMSLAAARGFEHAALAKQINEVAYWLLEHRHDDEAGPNWPAVIPLIEGQRAGPTSQPSRSAWCYGSPGVARALWLAGVALADDHLQKVAVQAMEAVYRRPVPSRGIDAPTLCHGVAGLLQVTLRFANDTRLPVFAEATADLVDQILDSVDPDRSMGIANVEPAGNLVDQPGFLDGAAGVALALLAAATDQEPRWDRVLALS